MSHYRVCIMKVDKPELVKFIKFDNKEDAEHFAKNQSVADSKHSYEVQKNNKEEFETIKAYVDGQETRSS